MPNRIGWWIGLALLMALPMVASADGNQGNQVVYLPALPNPPGVRAGVAKAYRQQFPLTQPEIRWDREQMAGTQYALHDSPTLTPRTRIIDVAVGPGNNAPVIHVMPSYVTAVTVTGIDGNPWPLVTQTPGNANGFSIQAPMQVAAKNKGPVGPDNLLLVQPKYFGETTNLVVTLKGSDTPLMIVFHAGSPKSHEVDGRVTLRIDRESPDAPPPLVIQPPPSAVDAKLLLFLEQTPPPGAKRLRVEGVSGLEAWSWDKHIVVRSRAPLVSPGWTDQVQQDGVGVYRLSPTSVLEVRGANGTTPVTLSRRAN